jgi:hypothetical protein
MICQGLTFWKIHSLILPDSISFADKNHPRDKDHPREGATVANLIDFSADKLG